MEIKNIIKNMLKENVNPEAQLLYSMINPSILEKVKNKEHSLKGNKIIPKNRKDDYEEELLLGSFKKALTEYKKTFDTEDVDDRQLLLDMESLIEQIKNIEVDNQDELKDFIIKIAKDEFDLDDDDVNITIEFSDSIENSQDSLSEIEDYQFDDYDTIEKTNSQIDKTQINNILSNGAASSSYKMLNKFEDDLSEINPTLINKYKKISVLNNLLTFLLDDGEKMQGATSSIEYPKDEGVCNVTITGIVLPAILFELVNCLMNIINEHGLPENKKLKEYVSGKSKISTDWGNRFGFALWNKFLSMLDEEDRPIKYQIYYEISTLPIDEYNVVMKDIMAQTKAGKNYIKKISKQVKDEMEDDEYEQTLKEISNSEFFEDPTELDNVLNDFKNG